MEQEEVHSWQEEKAYSGPRPAGQAKEAANFSTLNSEVFLVEEDLGVLYW